MSPVGFPREMGKNGSRSRMTGREVGWEMAGRKTEKLLLALLLLLLLFPVSPASGEGSEDPALKPHAYFQNSATCPRCHVTVKSVLEPDRFLPEADAFCLGCHSIDELGITHPQNVRPGGETYRMAVPKDLRLDSQGRMLCLTCHNAHGPFLSPTRAFAAQKAANPGAPAGTKPVYRTYFARRSDPVRGFVLLCEECHGKR